MRKLALTALLLLPAATAQTVPAVPATPATTPAPTSTPTAPVTVPAPVAPAPAAPVLLLTAPVGTALELGTTTTTRVSFSDVKVTAAPNSNISEAQLNDIRRSLALGTAKDEVTTTSGKVFMKVTGRDAAGQTTLLTSIIQNTGTQAGKPITMKATQQVGPDGTVTFKSMESDDPQVNAVLKTLSADKMRQFAIQDGTDFGLVYGQPLVVGEARRSTFSLDAQGMMGGLFSAFAGPEGQKLFSDIKISPIQADVTSVYKGKNAQGQHVFEITTNLNNWKMSFKTPATSPMPMTMNAEILSGTTKSTSIYRADALNTATTQTLNAKMRMVMLIQGVQVEVTMNMQQDLSMKPR